MSLREPKIQPHGGAAYAPCGRRVNMKTGPARKRRARFREKARYSTTSATTWLVAGSISTTRLFTIMYLYWRIPGTSTATVSGTA